jgi:hypothetical protein
VWYKQPIVCLVAFFEVLLLKPLFPGIVCLQGVMRRLVVPAALLLP